MGINLWVLRTFCPLMPFHFGIFGVSLGGSKGTSSSSFTEESEEELKKKQTEVGSTFGTAKTQQVTTAEKGQTSAQQEKTQALSEQLSTVSQLDEETQNIISGLLAGLGAGSGELVQAQQERALGTEDRLAGLTESIVASAEAKGEEQVGSVVQALSRQAGSSQNTIVQQLGLQESGRVNREIADLAATLGIQVDQLATQDIAGAVGGAEDIATQLANVLKGAEQKTTAQTTETAQTDIVTALQEILAQTETGTQTTKTIEKSIIDALGTASKTASGTGSGKSQEVGLGFSAAFG